MSRADLKIESGGFPVYDSKQDAKINAMRRAKSLPAIESPIIPNKGEALFTTAEEMHNEPSSCLNCVFYRRDHRCTLIGPRLPIDRITFPLHPSEDSKPIEYWPCCSMHTYGDPKNLDYLGPSDPDYIGLVWINAPKVGQKHGGANCGGCDGGDDCDHYIVDGKVEKWESPTGFCRALQTVVACGDVCSLWRDDDELGWREATKIIEEQNGHR